MAYARDCPGYCGHSHSLAHQQKSAVVVGAGHCLVDRCLPS